ncbi:hypothetical protein [Lysinibacillus sp. NPDC059133]|uniref:hypothetical protein n=1 Tax=Lysinibacillus sp. NPDC059133 TaxID=3346737 RepID=UPI0036B3971E
MKKVAFCFFSLILFINIIFMHPVRADAFSVVGSNALKATVIGTMERAGVKFENREAKERAFDAWNMKAYEKWRIDEATGRNKDLWEAFETIKKSSVTPTPLDEVPGFGKVLVNATWFGMAAWIGAEVGLDIQQNALDKTRMQYWADGYRTYEGISYNPSFGIRYGSFYEKDGWWKIDVLWILSSDRLTFLNSTYKDDPALYFHITKVEDYSSKDVKIFYEEQYRSWQGEPFIQKNDFLWDKTKIPPLEKYDFVPKPTDVPARNIPEPLTTVVEVPDVGKIPGVMPSAEPVPIIVPLGDPFADNPHNPPYEIPGKGPGENLDPGKDTDPEEDPDDKERDCNEPNEEMKVDSGVCEGIPYFGKKLEYIFGNATGNKNHIERSLALEIQLNSIGIFNDGKGKKLVLDNLSDAYNNPSSIIKTHDNGRVVRKSILTGPTGVLKVESVWDAEKLITIKLEEDVEEEAGGNVEDGDSNEGSENDLSNIKDLDDILNDPSILKGVKPKDLHKYLKENGYNPQPLSGGSLKGKPFEEGGGFKVTWGGDRILQYHPGSRHHGGVPYWKISSGKTGTVRYDMQGNIIK